MKWMVPLLGIQLLNAACPECCVHCQLLPAQIKDRDYLKQQMFDISMGQQYLHEVIYDHKVSMLDLYNELSSRVKDLEQKLKDKKSLTVE